MRSTAVPGPSTLRNKSSSERQKPWQAVAAAQIGQWFSSSRNPWPSARHSAMYPSRERTWAKRATRAPNVVAPESAPA
jgi:hypothetical protein